MEKLPLLVSCHVCGIDETKIPEDLNFYGCPSCEKYTCYGDLPPRKDLREEYVCPSCKTPTTTSFSQYIDTSQEACGKPNFSGWKGQLHTYLSSQSDLTGFVELVGRAATPTGHWPLYHFPIVDFSKENPSEKVGAFISYSNQKKSKTSRSAKSLLPLIKKHDGEADLVHIASSLAFYTEKDSERYWKYVFSEPSLRNMISVIRNKGTFLSCSEPCCYGLHDMLFLDMRPGHPYEAQFWRTTSGPKKNSEEELVKLMRHLSTASREQLNVSGIGLTIFPEFGDS